LKKEEKEKPRSCTEFFTELHGVFETTPFLTPWYSVYSVVKNYFILFLFPYGMIIDDTGPQVPVQPFRFS
jgi:hypothetical protein